MMIEKSESGIEKEELGSQKKIIEKQEQDIVFPITGIRFTILFTGMFFGFFMATLDTTILITALGKISEEFHSLEQIGWVGSAYLLSVSVCQPIYISVAEIFGQQIAYAGSVTLFLIGSVLCGASNSMTMLVICRAIQGMGATGLLISVLVITIDLMPAVQRVKYQGILAIAMGSAGLLGPVLGGILADRDQWRWCFYLNLFFGVPLVIIIAVLCKLPPTEKQLERIRQEKTVWEQIKQVDYATICLLMPSCCLLLVGLQLGAESLDFTKPLVLTLLIVSPVLFVAFVIIETYFVKSHPAFPRHFITSSHNIGVLIQNFVNGMVTNAFLYFIPLQFQIVRGDSALESAIKLFPQFVAGTLSAFVAGMIISRTGHYRALLWIGSVLTLVGAILFQRVTIDTSLLVIGVQLVLFGLGSGTLRNSIIVAGQAGVLRNELVIATSLGQFFRMIGGAFGINIAAVIFSYCSQTSINQLREKFHTNTVHATLSMLKYLPPVIQQEMRIAFLDSFNKIYILVAATSGFGLLSTFIVKSYNIRTKKRNSSKLNFLKGRQTKS